MRRSSADGGRPGSSAAQHVLASVIEPSRWRHAPRAPIVAGDACARSRRCAQCADVVLYARRRLLVPWRKANPALLGSRWCCSTCMPGSTISVPRARRRGRRVLLVSIPTVAPHDQGASRDGLAPASSGRRGRWGSTVVARRRARSDRLAIEPPALRLARGARLPRLHHRVAGDLQGGSRAWWTRAGRPARHSGGFEARVVRRAPIGSSPPSRQDFAERAKWRLLRRPDRLGQTVARAQRADQPGDELAGRQRPVLPALPRLRRLPRRTKYDSALGRRSTANGFRHALRALIPRSASPASRCASTVLAWRSGGDGGGGGGRRIGSWRAAGAASAVRPDARGVRRRGRVDGRASGKRHRLPRPLADPRCARRPTAARWTARAVGVGPQRAAGRARGALARSKATLPAAPRWRRRVPVPRAHRRPHAHLGRGVATDARSRSRSPTASTGRRATGCACCRPTRTPTSPRRSPRSTATATSASLSTRRGHPSSRTRLRHPRRAGDVGRRATSSLRAILRFAVLRPAGCEEVLAMRAGIPQPRHGRPRRARRPLARAPVVAGAGVGRGAPP